MTDHTEKTPVVVALARNGFGLWSEIPSGVEGPDGSTHRYVRVGALSDLVRPLMFSPDEGANVYWVDTPLGAYRILKAGDWWRSCRLFFVRQGPDGAQDVVGDGEGMTYAGAVAAANADYRARVMALFNVPGVS